jgi:hypothetical protein
MLPFPSGASWALKTTARLLRLAEVKMRSGKVPAKVAKRLYDLINVWPSAG